MSFKGLRVSGFRVSVKGFRVSFKGLQVSCKGFRVSVGSLLEGFGFRVSELLKGLFHGFLDTSTAVPLKGLLL